jgi:hypothetical protein
MATRHFTVPEQSGTSIKLAHSVTEPTEWIDAGELAERLKLPKTWVQDQTRSRRPKEGGIPHAKFGRYVRFLWNSPELNAWIAGRRTQ